MPPVLVRGRSSGTISVRSAISRSTASVRRTTSGLTGSVLTGSVRIVSVLIGSVLIGSVLMGSTLFGSTLSVTIADVVRSTGLSEVAKSAARFVC